MARLNVIQALTLTGMITGSVTLAVATPSLTSNQMISHGAVPAITPNVTIAQTDITTGLGGASPLAVLQDQPTLQTRPHVHPIGLRTQPPLHRQPTIASPLTGFCHPLNGLGRKSQGNNGTTHQGRMRYAYDISTPIGTPVYAMRSGRVVELQDRHPDTGGGRERAFKFNFVSLQHDGGYRSVYVHLQQHFQHMIRLNVGDWVNAGDLIGYSGNSGWSSGPHLHIEVQKPSKSPRRFTQTVPFAVKGYCAPQVVQG